MLLEDIFPGRGSNPQPRREDTASIPGHLVTRSPPGVLISGLRDRDPGRGRIRES